MRTLIFIICFLASALAWSQTSPQITVSTEKVKVNGAVMFVHKVKGGETLYSLSKAYHVAIDDIVRNNENLKAGLKEGSTIYIPSSTTAATPSNVPVDNEASSVSAKSFEFQLSGENIKKYSRKKHKVKKSESLESIAGKYGVSTDALVSFNNLQSRELRRKQVIYIPNEDFIVLLDEYAKVKHPEIPAEKDKTIVEQQEVDLNFDDNYTATLPDFGKVMDFTFILPLGLRDSIGPNSNFMDFYAGALLAADTIKEMGYDVTFNLVDQTLYGSVDGIISSGLLSGRKLIVGPVMFQDMAKVLSHTDNDAIVVSPMDMNGERFVASNRNYIQVPPAQNSHLENLIDLVISKSNLQNSIMVIYEKDGTDTALVKSVLDLLDAKGAIYNKFSYGILEGREVLDNIMYALEPGLENLVLVPSNSEAFVSDVVRNLNLLHTNPATEKKRSVVLFGTAKWKNFETIEVDYFHKMNLHLSLPYYVDYTSPIVKRFLMKYRALYNSEPTPFAFQGFDITMMFLNKSNLTTQSKYHFVREQKNTGIKNTGTVNVVYNKDYSISVIE